MRARRKGGPRRSRHPMPQPPRGGGYATEATQGSLEAFGPQAELCRRTMCAPCFALKLWSEAVAAGRRWDPAAIDWSKLPSGTEYRSVPHHEPARGTDCKTGDDGTISVCPPHHVRTPGQLQRFIARHPDFNSNPARFWELVGVGDYTRPRDEMRRRVAAKGDVSDG